MTSLVVFLVRRNKRVCTKGYGSIIGESWLCSLDVFFGYMAVGWARFGKSGSLCMLTDGVWLSGEETSYYNFLRPDTGENAWAPIQVCICDSKNYMYLGHTEISLNWGTGHTLPN